jgi:hypothetical protein
MSENERPPTVTEITRSATISEQNVIIAAAYFALLDARDSMIERGVKPGLDAVVAAIEKIEEWRQKRDPEPKPKERS